MSVLLELSITRRIRLILTPIRTFMATETTNYLYRIIRLPRLNLKTCSIKEHSFSLKYRNKLKSTKRQTTNQVANKQLIPPIAL